MINCLLFISFLSRFVSVCIWMWLLFVALFVRFVWIFASGAFVYFIFFWGGGYEIQLNLMPHWTIRVFQIAQDVKCTAKRQIPIASLYAHMRIGPKINRKTFLRWGSSIAVQYRFALSVKCWGPFSTKRSRPCVVSHFELNNFLFLHLFNIGFHELPWQYHFVSLSHSLTFRRRFFF